MYIGTQSGAYLIKISVMTAAPPLKLNPEIGGNASPAHLRHSVICQREQSLTNFRPSRPHISFLWVPRSQHTVASYSPVSLGCSAPLLGTSERRQQAAYHQAARILARSHTILNAKFYGREKYSKISVGNPLKIARNATCRGVPTLGIVVGDL